MHEVYHFKAICDVLGVQATKEDAYYFFERSVEEDDSSSSSSSDSFASSSDSSSSSDDSAVIVSDSSEDEDEEEEEVLYVIECADRAWYVGISTRDAVIEDMYTLNPWTELHDVHSLEKVIPVTSEFDCLFEFLRLCKLYGVDNVRCAHFQDVDLEKEVLRKIDRLM